MICATLNGMPDAGNPHVRFDEGEVVSAKPRRGPLLYKPAILVALVTVAVGTVARAGTTFCNPLSLPDCPRGYHATDDKTTHECRARFGAFRELGDPVALRVDGRWYLYASGGDEHFCWKSEDDGASWQYVKANPESVRLGYAPTVVRHRGRFLFCTGWGTAEAGLVYSAPTPEGPLTLLGKLEPPKAEGAPTSLADPMLFSDEDGKRLYLYWGCSPTGGIWGCELDADNPLNPVSPARKLVGYDPERHPWQKFPSRDYGYVEGAWMFKRDGGYYLFFAAGGTEFPTYATGVARGASPLGPFVLQENNPVFRTPAGVVTGTAHGSVTEDERGDWWYFYTVHMGIRHQFERRLGMDRLSFLPNGDVVAAQATSEPQRLPLAGKGAADWSRIPGVCLCGGAAFDESLETEFVPNRPGPYELEYEFLKPSRVRGFRIVWSDGGYDPAKGVACGPIRYRVLLKIRDGSWFTALDASGNDRDLCVDYREVEATEALAARLEIVGAPPGIQPRVVEWTLFGEDAAEVR